MEKISKVATAIAEEKLLVQFTVVAEDGTETVKRETLAEKQGEKLVVNEEVYNNLKAGTNEELMNLLDAKIEETAQKVGVVGAKPESPELPEPQPAPGAESWFQKHKKVILKTAGIAGIGAAVIIAFNMGKNSGSKTTAGPVTIPVNTPSVETPAPTPTVTPFDEEVETEVITVEDAYNDTEDIAKIIQEDWPIQPSATVEETRKNINAFYFLWNYNNMSIETQNALIENGFIPGDFDLILEESFPIMDAVQSVGNGAFYGKGQIIDISIFATTDYDHELAQHISQELSEMVTSETSAKAGYQNYFNWQTRDEQNNDYPYQKRESAVGASTMLGITYTSIYRTAGMLYGFAANDELLDNTGNDITNMRTAIEGCITEATGIEPKTQQR